MEILLVFLDLYEILPLFLKNYFSYFIETVALAQPCENDIPEKWEDPGLQDPGIYSGSLGWHPKVGRWVGTLW